MYFSCIVLTSNFASTAKNFELMKNPHPNRPHPSKSYLLRLVFLVLGCAFLGLGLVGIYTPMLPTTPFMILAAGCFARSSPKFYRWLITHRTFGRLLRDWEDRRAIPRYAKYLSWTMMSLSCALLFWRLPRECWWIAMVASMICLATAVWMARLPDA